MAIKKTGTATITDTGVMFSDFVFDGCENRTCQEDALAWARAILDNATNEIGADSAHAQDAGRGCAIMEPLIAVSLYPGKYMRIERHRRNADGMIYESRILNTAGEWIPDTDDASVELRPIVAIYRDAAALREYIATLQGYLDDMEKQPDFSFMFELEDKD